jgi:MFS family permease
MMAESKEFTTMLIGGAINGIGCGIFLPMSVTWTMRILPRSHMGFGVGAFFAMFFLGNFLNPLIIVPLADQLGSRAGAVEASGLAMIVISFLAGIFILVRGREALRKQQSALV